MNLKLYFLFILFINTFLGISQTSILFIGNSLTYFNNLPQTFKQICDSNNKCIEIKMVAFPGYSLINHLTTVMIPTDNPNLVFVKRITKKDTILPEAIKQLKYRKWDYVYLQDREVGEDSIEYAIQYIRKLVPESKIIIFENYMADSRWSKKYDRKKKEINIVECNRIAKLINADVVPVSYYFEKIKKKYSKDLLYDETMHPTKFGTIVIAILLYETIYLHEKLNFNSETFKFTNQEWKILKRTVVKN